MEDILVAHPDVNVVNYRILRFSCIKGAIKAIAQAENKRHP
jgi:hypothetical protein